MRTTLVVAVVAVAAVTVAAVFGARGPGDAAEANAAEAPWTFAASMSQRRSYIAAINDLAAIKMDKSLARKLQ